MLINSTGKKLRGFCVSVCMLFIIKICFPAANRAVSAQRLKNTTFTEIFNSLLVLLVFASNQIK